MPSRAYTSFLPDNYRDCYHPLICVNALSGLYLISTRRILESCYQISPVSMPSRAYTSFLQNATIWKMRSTGLCQCPLGLIPHFYYRKQMHQLHRSPVSMPSRAYTSFLRYPFKNLGFMRFPEPVFAGIYQNILTTAVFRAC